MWSNKVLVLPLILVGLSITFLRLNIDYWTRLTYAIELALHVNENIIITGDLNSNLLCSNNNKLIDLVNIFNLKNVIDKPTRISGNTSTLLDPIILSDILNCNYSNVLKIPRHISDHDAAIALYTTDAVHILLKCLYKARKVSGHVFVC
jgi:hypothetical protein